MKIWKPMAGVVLWQEEVMGMVSIQKRSGRPEARTELLEDHIEGSFTNLHTDASIATSVNSSRVAANDKLMVIILFDETKGPLASMEVFNLALSTFVTVAERGLESRIDRFTEYASILTMTSIEIIANEDSRGNVKLLYRHVRIAMMVLINDMIAKKKFVTAKIRLLEDEVEIATGEVFRRT